MRFPRGFLEFHADPNSYTYQGSRTAASGLSSIVPRESIGSRGKSAEKSIGVSNVVHVAGGFPPCKRPAAKLNPRRNG